MTLVSSGELYMGGTSTDNKNTEKEVFGSNTAGRLFSEILAAAIPNKGNPVGSTLSEFYGHTQGSGYGGTYDYYNNASYPTSYFVYGGSVVATFNNGDNTVLKHTATGSPVTCYVAQGPAGQPWSGEISVTLKRRARTYGASWSVVSTWASYSSQTASCDFSNYDYIWEIT